MASPIGDNSNFRPVPSMHSTLPSVDLMCSGRIGQLLCKPKIWWDSIMRAAKRIIVLEMVLIRKGGYIKTKGFNIFIAAPSLFTLTAIGVRFET